MRHKVFFDLVQKAREACAGDTSMKHTTKQVKDFISQAISFGRRDDVPVEYTNFCHRALAQLEANRTYSSRVTADQFLCKVLNTMLAKEREDSG